VLETCACVIAPDSSILHLASALDVPAVGLFGSIPWHLRTGYAEKTFSLQGKCSHGVCFHHERNGQVWPIAGPCQKSGLCDALDSLEPARIVAKLESLT
jgi:ADP-heptose:LPS heptosyltransferase